MRIQVVRQIIEDYEIYKIKTMEYCCEKLKKNPMIHLYHNYVENAYCRNCEVPDDFDCKDCQLNEITDDCGRKLAMMIQEKDVCQDPWSNDYSTDYRYFPIDFCPHCGKKIEIEVVGEECVTAEYKSLVEQRNNLYRQIQLTDSKKKEEKLRKELSDITKKMNSMYEDCSWYKTEE